MRRRIILGGDNYEAVDLGIYIGGKKLLWATKNVGAKTETDYGNYYQYGKGSRTYQQTSGETEYRGIENPLAISYDTAYQVMGEDWRMPTQTQFEALLNQCNWTWNLINGVTGCKCTSRTDSSKYIFLPAAGYWYGSSKSGVGSLGRYWSSTPSSYINNALNMVVSNGSQSRYVSEEYRSVGCSVRGVKEVPLDESDFNGHAFVDLGLPSGTLWATMNVGANSETNYGNYYQYGKGAKTYQQTSGESVYQGTEDPLASSADTAVQVWGGAWHMPTQTQLNELTANTNYSWTTINGVRGGKFTSRTDISKYIFLPAGGVWEGRSNYEKGYRGWYLTSTPSDGDYSSALVLMVDQYYNLDNPPRPYGYSVRPVIG